MSQPRAFCAPPPVPMLHCVALTALEASCVLRYACPIPCPLTSAHQAAPCERRCCDPASCLTQRPCLTQCSTAMAHRGPAGLLAAALPSRVHEPHEPCRHEVFNRSEYWRLSDPNRKPPGVLGWWPSRSTTFLEVRCRCTLRCAAAWSLNTGTLTIVDGESWSYRRGCSVTRSDCGRMAYRAAALREPRACMQSRCGSHAHACSP
jgi:hypothetical protein